MGPIVAKPAEAPFPSVAAWLLARPDLYARLHAFHYLPTLEMHPSWHELCFPPAIARLLASGKLAQTAAHRWLSQHVLARLRPEGGAAPSLAPGLVFALLDRERLWRLVQHAAAVLVASEVRSALGAQAVAAWRAALGPDLHAYAMQRAPLLCTPEAGAAIAPPDAAAVPPERRFEQAATAAVRLLRQATRTAPGVWERLKLKLPRSVAAAADVPDAPPAGAERLLQRVLREIEPQWHSSFTSPAA